MTDAQKDKAFAKEVGIKRSQFVLVAGVFILANRGFPVETCPTMAHTLWQILRDDWFANWSANQESEVASHDR